MKLYVLTCSSAFPGTKPGKEMYRQAVRTVDNDLSGRSYLCYKVYRIIKCYQQIGKIRKIVTVQI